MSEKLEPCPWCGEQPEFSFNQNPSNGMAQLRCRCGLASRWRTKLAVAYEWNNLSASVRAGESKDAEIARLRDVARAAEETRIAALEEAACAACPWCWNHRAGGVNWSKARLDSDTNRWVHLAQGYPPRLCTSDRIRDLIHAARSSGARGGGE